MSARTVLVSGIGIAGPTLAYWLLQHGFKPTLIEKAPRLRTGGYVVDFWGLGYDAAEKMGLLPEIERAGYHVKDVRFVNSAGRTVSGFKADVFRRMADNRFVSLRRSDLSRLIVDRIHGECEMIFGDSIASLAQSHDGVDVTFEHAQPRRFDVVIGADGLHSVVRERMFGPESRFETFLNYMVIAFDAGGYRPREELAFVTYGLPGKQAARFAMRDDHTMFLLVIACEHPPDIAPEDVDAQRALAHHMFDGAGWECDRMLSAMDACEDVYCDRVSQIRLDAWSQGNIGLVGDAAFCPSLLAGQGTALAMAAAYVLAGELARPGRSAADALAAYESVLRAFITHKQDAAQRFASSFAPRTRFGIVARNVIMRTLGIPWVADHFLGGNMVDRLVLPNYEDVAAR